MADDFPLLHQCYRSGQISESQWQEHLEDPKFKEWIETMNDEVKHTPLPWCLVKSVSDDGYTNPKAFTDGIYGDTIFSETDEIKIAITVNDVLGMDGNAAFIIKACNSHYQLVEENKRLRDALESTYRWLDAQCPILDGDKSDPCKLCGAREDGGRCMAMENTVPSKIREKIESALAQHKGGE